MRSGYIGLKAWLLQRITAVYLLGFLLYFLAHCLRQPGPDFAAWRGWILSPGPRLGLLLFFVALALHVWVGLRDVIIDYVKPVGLRVILLGLVAFSLGAIVGRAGLLLGMT